MTDKTAVALDATLPTDLPAQTRNRILIYLGTLTLMVAFGAPFGGLINLPITYFLKNRLHFSAVQVSGFLLVTGIPLYFSAIWGFVRDNWSPFGIRDRGYMILFGFTCAAIYAIAAFAPVTPLGLGGAVIALTAAFLFVHTGQIGLTAAIARQHVMSGQVSALWNAVSSIPLLAAYAAGGFLSNALEGKDADLAARILFLTGGAVLTVIATFALWRPKVVFDNLRDGQPTTATPLKDVARLVRHWPIYPALIIWCLWNFSPGAGTPLQFFLQNQLHADDATFGLFAAVQAGFFIPTYMVYGVLCRRVRLGRLIFWGTLIGVPQLVPLLFIHSSMAAVLLGAPVGLMGGVCTAAFLDLIIRSCPKGLEGTMMMLATAFSFIAGRLGDLLGTYLYSVGGFVLCVGAVTLSNLLILPLITVSPKTLLATSDGEAPPDGGFDAD